MHPYPYQTKRKRILHKTNDVSTRESPVFIQLLLGQFELQTTIHSHLRPLSHGLPPFAWIHHIFLPVHPSLCLSLSFPLISHDTRTYYTCSTDIKNVPPDCSSGYRLFFRIPPGDERRTEQVTIIFPRLGYVRLSAMLLHSSIYITHLKTRFFPIICTYFSHSYINPLGNYFFEML